MHTRRAFGAALVAVVAGGALAAAAGVAAGEKLVAGSVWKGHSTADDRRNKDSRRKVEFKVDRRDGDHFTGTIKADWKRPLTLKVDGTVADNGDVELRPADGDRFPKGIVFPGHVDGRRLTFKMLKAPDENAQGADVELTCEPEKKKKQAASGPKRASVRR